MQLRFFQSVLAKLVGADAKLLASVSEDERSQINNAGLASLAGISFQFLCVGVGCAGFIRPDSFLDYAMTGISTAAVTAVIYFFDRAMIAAHFRQAGETYCESAGLKVQRGSQWKKTLAIIARAGLSAALAFSLAYPVLLTFFGPEVEGELLRASREANSNLYRTVAVRADEKLNTASSAIELLNKQIEALMKERVVLVESMDPNITKAPLIKSLEDLQKDFAIVDEERAKAQIDADAEEFGQKINPNHTGKIGTGPAHKFHMARVADAERRMKEVRSEIQRVQANLDTLNSGALTIPGMAPQKVAGVISELDEKIASARMELKSAVTEKTELTDGRAKWIGEQAQLDASYIPQAEGLIQRFKALYRLIGDDPALLTLVLLIKLVIMALEAAGPLVAWLFLLPGEYSVRVAIRMRDFVDAEIDRAAEASFERERRDSRRVTELNGYRRRRSAQDQVHTEFENMFQERAANE